MLKPETTESEKPAWKRRSSKLRKLTQDNVDQSIEMYKQGMSIAQIAPKFGVSKQAMHSILKRRIELRPPLRDVPKDVRASLPTQARVRELFDYEPETGMFLWRKSDYSPNVKPGSEAGTVRKRDGRRILCIDGKQYRANRVAWLYVTGAWPKGDVDHKDGDKSNDRSDNLRDVSRLVNSQNQRHPKSNKRIGTMLGCYWNGSSWVAQIKFDGRVQYLGSFQTEAEAHDKYVSVKRRVHEGCTI